jgi:hypothetical protein
MSDITCSIRAVFLAVGMGTMLTVSVAFASFVPSHARTASITPTAPPAWSVTTSSRIAASADVRRVTTPTTPPASSAGPTASAAIPLPASSAYRHTTCSMAVAFHLAPWVTTPAPNRSPTMISACSAKVTVLIARLTITACSVSLT